MSTGLRARPSADREPIGLVVRPEPTVNTTLRTALLSLSALTLLATACGDDDDGGGASPVVADAWVREPAAGTSRTAAYANITNEGDEAITLVAASTPLTDQVEIHETLVDEEGTMAMQEREDGFVIEAGDTLVMEPGGPHVMLLDVDPADVTGEIEITYEFDGADDVTVQADVEALAAGDEMGDMDSDDTDDMDSDDMDDMESDDMSDMESDTTEG